MCIVTNLRAQVNKQDVTITELEVMKNDVKTNADAIKDLKSEMYQKIVNSQKCTLNQI